MGMIQSPSPLEAISAGILSQLTQSQTRLSVVSSLLVSSEYRSPRGHPLLTQALRAARPPIHLFAEI
eukprot:m.206082 g.206082  ORF g.206082 m.206082 type:complete len:67 (+) comp53882_c0_seq2:818-1018(+)